MLKIAWNPHYVHPLPAGHRFPMIKYELLPEQLLHEGTIAPSSLFSPPPLAESEILACHEEEYWNRLKLGMLATAETRAIGFPWSEGLVLRERIIASGTVLASRIALKEGIAMNIAGGTHHAYAGSGGGFCLLNDIAIAAVLLLTEGLARRILIVDLDVHQGNGTAGIFRDVPEVFTFSMHGRRNYPLRKERSDCDIALEDGTGDTEYLGLLGRTLPELIDRFEPDFVFYLSGVDVLAGDRLGRLALSLDGCRQRDRLVLQHCRNHRLPVAVSMGGGYSQRLAHIIEAHANTFRLAQQIFF
jgi:acetoin utilization deacetylase AcuC-like enzyme